MDKCVYCLQLSHKGICKKDNLVTALDNYETKRFLNQMVDRWSDQNYAFDNQMREYIREIKRRLEVIGNENTDNN
jgi:hypothetical protein